MLAKSVVVVVTLFACSLASDVMEIGDADFNTRVAETETTLVMFYAPWYVFAFFIHSFLVVVVFAAGQKSTKYFIEKKKIIVFMCYFLTP